LEVTLRGFSETLMDQQQQAVERIVRGVCAAGRAPREPEVELLEQTIAVVNDADVTARVRAVHQAMFPVADLVDLPWPNNGSEDFAFFGTPGPDRYDGPAIPSTMWFFGATPAGVWNSTVDEPASVDEEQALSQDAEALRQRIGRMPGQHTPY